MKNNLNANKAGGYNVIKIIPKQGKLPNDVVLGFREQHSTLLQMHSTANFIERALEEIDLCTHVQAVGKA